MLNRVTGAIATIAVAEAAAAAETFTMAVKEVSAPYDKYTSLRSTKPIKAEKELSWSELVFGEAEPTEFQSLMANWSADRSSSTHRLRATAASKKLSTLDGFVWTGAVYMGSEQTPYDVIFDNASDWLSLEGVECKECEGGKYDPSTSSLSKQVGVDYSERTFGDVTMLGVEWVDEVCVTSQACIKDFEYFLVKQESGLKEPMDGIFGLARNHPYYLAKDDGIQRGPSYMLALKNAELISEDTFSFYMAPYGKDSSLDFGKPRTDRMRDPEELRWIDLQEDFFWSAYC